VATIFDATDPFGDLVRLTSDRWRELQAKHGEIPDIVAGIGENWFLALLRATIEQPDKVREGLTARDSKMFYSEAGVISVRPYTNCRLAVIVRYTREPASVRTIYVTAHMQGKVGKLLLGGER